TSSAIRWVLLKSSKQCGGAIHLACHVKPGTSTRCEGITAVNAEAIELCVAAQVREGEANKAVRELIAEVLNVPKSDVQIAKGMKSRDKIVVMGNFQANGSEEDVVNKTKEKLQEAVNEGVSNLYLYLAPNPMHMLITIKMCSRSLYIRNATHRKYVE
ncbi:hypothetical protein M501DRAFT_941308, partial [Patellaria atrata CBS 101060]